MKLLNVYRVNRESQISILFYFQHVLLLSFITLCSLSLSEAAEPRGSEKFSGLEIEGSEKFIKQVIEALEILKQKTPEAFEIIKKYVDIIKQGKHSCMWADIEPTAYEMADRTAFYSVTWCASTIAHDSFHSKLYHDYKNEHSETVPRDIWVGVEAEKKCLSHQLEVLKKIGAPVHEIEHCKAQDGTHYDMNKDGKYDWDDFEKQNW